MLWAGLVLIKILLEKEDFLQGGFKKIKENAVKVWKQVERQDKIIKNLL